MLIYSQTRSDVACAELLTTIYMYSYSCSIETLHATNSLISFLLNLLYLICRVNNSSTDLYRVVQYLQKLGGGGSLSPQSPSDATPMAMWLMTYDTVVCA